MLDFQNYFIEVSCDVISINAELIKFFNGKFFFHKVYKYSKKDGVLERINW